MNGEQADVFAYLLSVREATVTNTVASRAF